MSIYKNIASQKIAVYAWDSINDAPKTGDAANITAQISLDGAATAATNDANPTELDATDAPGVYLFDTTQAETNADLIVLSAVSATAGILIEPLIIYTIPGDSTAIAADAIEISGDATAANNLELDYDGTGYAKANSTIGTTTTNTDLVTAAAIADQVWEEAIADHSGTSGSTAEALDGAVAPTAAAIATAVHEYVVESGNPVNAQTFEEIMRIVLAVLAGKGDSNYDWGAISPDGVTTRVAGSLNSSGIRTSIDVLDGSV